MGHCCYYGYTDMVCHDYTSQRNIPGAWATVVTMITLIWYTKIIQLKKAYLVHEPLLLLWLHWYGILRLYNSKKHTWYMSHCCCYGYSDMAHREYMTQWSIPELSDTVVAMATIIWHIMIIMTQWSIPELSDTVVAMATIIWHIMIIMTQWSIPKLSDTVAAMATMIWHIMIIMTQWSILNYQTLLLL